MIKMLSYKGQVAGETRPAYFLRAFEKDVLQMRILSFARCNFNCPYCKRDGQRTNADGSIRNAVNVHEDDLLFNAEKAVKTNEVIRLSGGDPVTYPQTSEKILKHCKELGGIGSIAHNGSNINFIKKVLPYLDFAAIDIKAATPEGYAFRTGLSDRLGHKMLRNSLQIQEILTNTDVLVDVRTCIFSTTTLEELFRLAEMIVSAGKVENKFWTIRTYTPVAGCDWRPLSIETTLQYLHKVKAHFPELKMGIRTKWKSSGLLFV